MEQLKQVMKKIVSPVDNYLDKLTIKLQTMFVNSYKKSIENGKIPILYRMFGNKYGYALDELGIPYSDRHLYSGTSFGTFDFGYTLGKLPKWLYDIIYRTNKNIKDKHLIVMFTYAKSLLSSNSTEFNAYKSLKDVAAIPPYLRIVCLDIAKKIQEGKSPATVMKEEYSAIFPKAVVLRLELAEITSKQETVYDELRAYYEERIKRRKQIMKVLIYPVIVFALLIAIVLGFKFMLLPQYVASLDDPKALPDSFKRLDSIANFILNPIKMLIAVVSIVSIHKFMSNTSYGRRLQAMISLSIPGLKNLFITIGIQAWFRELDSLLSSGLTEVKAVAEAPIVVKNELIRDTLREEYTKMMSESKSFAACSKDIPFYSIEISTLIDIGSETSTVADNIHTINLKISETLDDLFETMNQLLTPLIVMVLGIVIITILLPVFSDITNATNIVK